MIDIEELAEIFVETADTLVDEFDVIEFLQLITVRAARMSRATAAGIVLADPHGHLQFVAASEESIGLLEVLALHSEEGPCQDCFRSGAPVVNTDLAETGSRWPAFAAAATDSGYRSVHVLPMRHRANVVGALSLFSRDTQRLDAADVRIIQALADVATIGILQERAISAGTLLAEQLQNALTSRISIEQAKGMLSRIHHVSVDNAFDLMRTYARHRRLRLSEVALAVVTDPMSHPELTGVQSR